MLEVRGCGPVWGWAAGLNVHGDTCQAAVSFKILIFVSCFLQGGRNGLVK